MTDFPNDTRLNLAVRAAALGIWDWNIQTGEMMWSERAKEIAGFPPGEAVSFAAVRAITHPEDLPHTSAMARRALDPTLRTREPYEYRLLRRDGSIRWVVAHGEAVFETIDGVEQATRYIGTIQDISEAKDAETALRASESRLRLALDAARLCVWDYEVASERIRSSPDLNRLLGYPPDQVLETKDLQSRYHPDDREKVREAGLAALAAGHRHFQTEYRFIRPDGAERWLLVRAEITLDGDAPTRVIGVVMDVTERKEAERRQDFLVSELNHRVKNTLAVVQALAGQSFRNAEGDGDAYAAFNERLLAFSKAHAVLFDNDWRSADLTTIVAATIGPYQDELGIRFDIAGPAVALSPQLAITLAMVLHELCTNAVKYGSLSDEAGSVKLHWTRDETPDGRMLRLRWEEKGGPPVSPPERAGFGSRMIKSSFANRPDANATLDYLPGGVVCVIEVPADGAGPG